ncbi:hypothetical protein SPWS13_2383 [Shewanella putrefaciens]|nr:hypothetical protein SPWS13_2383 [Shewanella putrefaciens]
MCLTADSRASPRSFRYRISLPEIEWTIKVIIKMFTLVRFEP